MIGTTQKSQTLLPTLAFLVDVGQRPFSIGVTWRGLATSLKKGGGGGGGGRERQVLK